MPPFTDSIPQPASEPSDLLTFLVDMLRMREPNAKALVDRVSTLLDISANTAYKKISGVNAFSVPEVLALCRAFHISLDAFLFGARDYVFVRFKPQVTPLGFLSDLVGHLDAATKLPDARLWYATTEIPVFHYAYFPELTAFKLFVWRRRAWPLPDGASETSMAELAANDQLRQLCRSISQMYNELPSTEFWPLNFLDNTLRQIAFMEDCTPPEEKKWLDTVRGQVRALVTHQRAMAEKRRKFLPDNPAQAASFELYHNEITHTNNTLLLESPSFQSVFTTFDNPNYFQSTDLDLCRYTRGWFHRLSTPQRRPRTQPT